MDTLKSGRYHFTSRKLETSMQQNILYIGLDVDDTQYHGSAFNKDTGEAIVEIEKVDQA